MLKPNFSLPSLSLYDGKALMEARRLSLGRRLGAELVAARVSMVPNVNVTGRLCVTSLVTKFNRCENVGVARETDLVCELRAPCVDEV